MNLVEVETPVATAFFDFVREKNTLLITQRLSNGVQSSYHGVRTEFSENINCTGVRVDARIRKFSGTELDNLCQLLRMLPNFEKVDLQMNENSRWAIDILNIVYQYTEKVIESLSLPTFIFVNFSRLQLEELLGFIKLNLPLKEIYFTNFEYYEKKISKPGIYFIVRNFLDVLLPGLHKLVFPLVLLRVQLKRLHLDKKNYQQLKTLQLSPRETIAGNLVFLFALRKSCLVKNLEVISLRWSHLQGKNMMPLVPAAFSCLEHMPIITKAFLAFEIPIFRVRTYSVYILTQSLKFLKKPLVLKLD
eukprot:snap_masked-scaffold_44-processed-gene-0.43-mRNA-1 protein AED:1.00 eAED:1.00 QI:0/-1/0/0/-1/1/1/0/303